MTAPTKIYQFDDKFLFFRDEHYMAWMNVTMGDILTVHHV